jgi:hypothetical protein
MHQVYVQQHNEQLHVAILKKNIFSKKNFFKISTCKSLIIAFVSFKLVKSHRINDFLFTRLNASPE